MNRASRQLFGPAGQRLCPCGSRQPLMRCTLCQQPQRCDSVGTLCYGEPSTETYALMGDRACKCGYSVCGCTPELTSCKSQSGGWCCPLPKGHAGAHQNDAGTYRWADVAGALPPPAEQLPPGWVRDIDVDYPAYDNVGGSRVVIQADGKFWRWRAPEQSIDESPKYETCNIAMAAALGIEIRRNTAGQWLWRLRAHGAYYGVHDTADAAALAALHAHAGQKPVEQPRKPDEPFRVGDRVRVLNTKANTAAALYVPYMQPGQEHVIAFFGGYDCIWFNVDGKPVGGWDHGRFELVTPAPEQP